MEFDEWAVEAAGQVVAHVERHGLACTWSEAHERLMTHAGRGPRRLMYPVAAEDADSREDIMVTEDGQHLAALCDPLGWQHPDFIESVACSHVHFLEKPYYPREPSSSSVGVAVPLTVVTEAVHRLNFLLHARLQDLAPRDHDTVQEIARITTNLVADLREEVEWVIDQRHLDDARIDESDIILSRASDLFAAARLLDEGAATACTVGDEAADWLTTPRDRDELRDPMHIECCVRSLHWWLGTD